MFLKTVLADGQAEQAVIREMKARAEGARGDIEKTVRAIMDDVKARGWDAVCSYAEKFDGQKPYVVGPELLEQAEHLLLIPDYLHYRLTGQICTEYTNATTTALVNAHTRDWDWELIDRLGLPRRLFCKLVQPGERLGDLLPDVARRAGYSCSVVLPATHDTGSAVLAVPAQEENFLFLSSGTWSLIGMERCEPDCSAQSRAANFTNEGGYGGTIRYLKNIMGL